MTTHIGREAEMMSAMEKLNLKLVKSDELVEYSDTTVNLFTVPAYTVVVGLFCRVDTAFDQNVDIAIGDGTTEDLFGKCSGGVDGGSLGKARGSTDSLGLVAFWPLREVTAATTIKATVTTRVQTGGTALAAGKTTWYMMYKPVALDRNPDA